jgi:chromosome segregation ATPase
MDYESNEFLVDGSVARTYDELSYHDKIKVRALQGLDQLAASLNSIANVKAIEFQINHLNEMTSGFTEQMSAKDDEIADLTDQLNNVASNVQQQLADQAAQHQASLAQATAASALLEAELASLKAANESLKENFDKFKAVLTSIDHLTDEVID